MMDKIVVTAADIEKLLAWRDEHNDLVRSMPVPLREVEIQIVESGISIKCFRSDKKLKLYLDSPARKLGHVVFAPLGNGLWKKKVSTLPADCNPAETEQGALTVYGSLMALMTYGAGSIRGGVATTTSKAPAERKSSTKPNTASTTYIIHSAGKQHQPMISYCSISYFKILPSIISGGSSARATSFISLSSGSMSLRRKCA